MDEAIRIYLLEIKSMPLLTDEEEQAAVRRIRATDMRFRRHALACGFVLRGALDSMRAVAEDREPFHRVVEESATICSADRVRVRKDLSKTLAAVEDLLRGDEETAGAAREACVVAAAAARVGTMLRRDAGGRTIPGPRTGPCRRDAAGAGRREAVRLLAESPLRTEFLLGLYDRLCDMHRRAGRIAAGRQTALPGEFADLLGRMGETTAALARRIGKANVSRQAYEASKHTLLCGNLRLVFSIARRYCHRGLSLLDLVQEGNMGLMRAVDKVNGVFECPFSHYAAWWITQAIRRALGDHAGPIKVPPYATQAIARMRTLAGRLSQDRRHQPNPDELAEATGLPPKKLFNLLQLQRQPLRLNCYGDEAQDDGEGTADWLPVDSRQSNGAREAWQAELHVRIEDALRGLPDKQQEVLRLRFGLSDRRARTLREIGRTLSLTKERIRQLEQEALGRLRAAEAGRRLADFLPGDALCSIAANGAASCNGAH